MKSGFCSLETGPLTTSHHMMLLLLLLPFFCRRLPQPGSGPSRDVMMNGYWKHTMIGLTEEKDGQQPQVGSCSGAIYILIDAVGHTV